MDCGIPFCHDGCPLGNLIPEWNDLVYRDDWPEAIERLHATNNFPEFTGRLCPAPCEASCVLGINDDPVTIERIEYEIVERAWDEGWVTPQVPTVRTGKSVAVVGSGPAGLAAAQQLARAGHSVTVFERAERPGGLLRYGIPEFKMEKAVLDRRLAQMEAEGVTFVCSRRWAVSSVARADGARRRSSPARQRGSGRRAPPTCGCARRPRCGPPSTPWCWPVGPPCRGTCRCPGVSSTGVHLALEYLKPSNLVQEGALGASPITAKGKRVVIIGGGDTGADCLGTAHRQGAASVHQLEIMAEPPSDRLADNPWPLWPLILRTSSAHEEGGERLVLGDDDRVRRRRRRRGAGPARPRGRDAHRGRPPGLRGGARARSSSWSATWCSWPWASSGTERRRRRRRSSGVEVGPRGTVVADADVGDQRRGGLRVRRPDPGPEPDRVGDRRGPLVCRRGRPLADGHDVVAGAARARPAGTALTGPGRGDVQTRTSEPQREPTLPDGACPTVGPVGRARRCSAGRWRRAAPRHT